MPLDSLPAEILLEVLGHLQYQDLKTSIPFISKSFSHMLMRSSNPGSATDIDKHLFRDAPRPLNQRLHQTQYVYHPFFLQTGGWNPYAETSIEDILLPDGKKLIETEICNENAVSPAVTKVVYTPRLCIGMLREPVVIEGTGYGGAVTIQDVMRAPIEQARQWKETGYERLPKSWESLCDLEVINGVAYFTNRFCAAWPFK